VPGNESTAVALALEFAPSSFIRSTRGCAGMPLTSFGSRTVRAAPVGVSEMVSPLPRETNSALGLAVSLNRFEAQGGLGIRNLEGPRSGHASAHVLGIGFGFGTRRKSRQGKRQDCQRENGSV
jgi:hypothetical protein